LPDLVCRLVPEVIVAELIGRVVLIGGDGDDVPLELVPVVEEVLRCSGARSHAQEQGYRLHDEDG